jgi:hypothetical protein
VARLKVERRLAPLLKAVRPVHLLAEHLLAAEQLRNVS